jgi:ATP-dependent Lon protease
MSDDLQPDQNAASPMGETTAQSSSATPNDALVSQEITALRFRIEEAHLPDALRDKIEREFRLLERAAQTGAYSNEYERTAKYVDWCLRIPWQNFSEDKLDLDNAKQVFEKHHYGMQSVKDRIIEYMSILKLQRQNFGETMQANQNIRAPILFFVGLVGTGKTTFAYSIAEALGRPIVRIPFGGMGSARDLRGESRLHTDAEPGLMVRGLVQAGVRNPVVLLDEIDRVAEDARMDIMGVLVELLDPSQNQNFTDHYIDAPMDLSQVLFIATANNTRGVATAVLDRMEQIDMPSYSDQEKTIIAQKYVIPKLLEQSGMKPGSLIIADDVWPKMVRPLGYDAGIRTLERTLKGAVSKAARLMLEQNLQQVVITNENIKYFVPAF